MIPCEFCSKPFKIKEVDSHQRRCVGLNKMQIEEELKKKQEGGELKKKGEELKKKQEELIPCEFCNKPLKTLDLDSHQRRCVGLNQLQIEEDLMKKQDKLKKITEPGCSHEKCAGREY